MSTRELKPISFDKRLFLISLLISGSLNFYFFISNYMQNKNFCENGSFTDLYMKSLPSKSFLENKMASVYYITKEGKYVFNNRKNIWAYQIPSLEAITQYIKMDAVIYDKNNPSDYILKSEFTNYSVKFSLFAYLFGTIFITAWIYLMSFKFYPSIKSWILKVKNSKNNKYNVS